MAANQDIIATLSPSPGRRYFALFLLFTLGILLLYVALTADFATTVMQVFIGVMGLGALFMGEQMRKSTMHALELTRDGIRATNGRLLCQLDNIAAADRGPFAFKPSNGFTIRLKEPETRAWEPGLWWRFGRRIGVGGVTPAAEGKLMADLINAYLAQGDFPSL